MIIDLNLLLGQVKEGYFLVYFSSIFFLSLAFNAFNKGCFLVHAGQETEQTKTSSLFEKDWVDCRNVYPLEDFIRQLIQIKKNPIIQSNNSKY
jgi:hypothetical protein